MTWVAENPWVVVAAVLAVVALVVIFRYSGGFRARAEGLGGSFELVGKGAEPRAGAPGADAGRRAVEPGVNAAGEGSVAIGRDANRSTIVTGDRNRTR